LRSEGWGILLTRYQSFIVANYPMDEANRPTPVELDYARPDSVDDHDVRTYLIHALIASAITGGLALPAVVFSVNALIAKRKGQLAAAQVWGQRSAMWGIAAIVLAIPLLVLAMGFEWLIDYVKSVL